MYIDYQHPQHRELLEATHPPAKEYERCGNKFPDTSLYYNHSTGTGDLKYGWASDCNTGKVKCKSGYIYQKTCNHCRMPNCFPTWVRTICKKDYSNIYENMEKYAKCCLDGGSECPPHTCPQNASIPGTRCFIHLTNHCKDPNNFFSDNCKRWLKTVSESDDAGAKSTIDDIAKTVCTMPGNSDMDFCKCWNAKVPEYAKEGLTGEELAWLEANKACIDPICNDPTKALQPSQKLGMCPRLIQICNIDNVRVNIENHSQVDAINFKNECKSAGWTPGQPPDTPPVTPPDTPPDTPPVTPPDTLPVTPPDTPPTNWLKNYWPILVGSLAGLIFLMLVARLVSRRRRYYY